jgi:N-acetylglucosamine-6-sulfatase
MPRADETRSGGRATGAALLAVLTCALVALAPSGGEAKQRTAKKQKRPNVVLVMTDDQHADSVRFMPQLQRLIAGRGVTFDNSYVTYSLCCPSRATWLTGQYPHNHGVRTNTPPAGGYSKLAPTLSNSLPVWLQRSGYYTGHIGKFLNGYGTTSPDTEIPPGWSEWYGAVDDPDAFTGGTYTMYGYTLNENGSIVHYGSTPDVVDPATYQTDVYSQKAQDFIRRRAPSRKPFFLSVAPLASHGEAGGACACAGNNPRAAPRHEGAFAAESLPKPPSYNEADVSDKPKAIQDLAPIGPTAEQQITARYRARIESLLAVDEMVASLVAVLRDRRELKNTVIIFTSDNGFFHGEHRVRNGKVRLYEPSVRVPLIIRGPGLPRGKSRGQPVANIDLAPTILDFANAKAARVQDGRSLRPVIDDKLLEWGRAILLEAFFNADPDEDPETPPTNYQAVRTDRYLFARYGTGELELYDLLSDPFEVRSRHSEAAYAQVKASLDRLLGRLSRCAGRVCGSRPALKLRLEFRSAGGCVASGIVARLTGGSRGEVESARFLARGKKAGADGRAPFERKVGAGQLSGSRKNRIGAIATMLDGRRASVVRSAPPRC